MGEVAISYSERRMGLRKTTCILVLPPPSGEYATCEKLKMFLSLKFTAYVKGSWSSSSYSLWLSYESFLETK